MSNTNQFLPPEESLQRVESNELQQTRAMALAQHEIQSAILIAKKFPRNEDQCFQSLMRTCKRTSFAEAAAYSFPRGGTTVAGPSVNLAREAARVWQNIRYGFEINNDTDQERTVRGYAWDVETNTRVEQDDTFKKLVQRKQNGKTQWVEPDERDLRELTNKRGAIAMRNCLLQILPKDIVEEALAQCRETLQKNAEQDPDSLRKKIVAAFDELNITVAMLEQYLAHPIAQCQPAELNTLRGMWKSISDGNTTWADYVQPPASDKARAATEAKVDQLKNKYIKQEPSIPESAPIDEIALDPTQPEEVQVELPPVNVPQPPTGHDLFPPRARRSSHGRGEGKD